MGEIGLALVRNSLSRGVYRDQERLTLANIREDVLRSSESPYRHLVLDVIDRGMAHAEAGEFPAAHNEINFIHNLPLGPEDLAGWTGDWFYQAEIASYFTRCEDPARIAHVIELLADAAQRRRGERTRDDYRAFLTDLGPRLVDEALDAKLAANATADGPDADYLAGTLLGWHNAISAVRSLATTYEIPLEDLRLAEFDPLRDLLG